MNFLRAIGWICFGFFLTPGAFFLALGFYLDPSMLIHFYKFFVCWYLFYLPLEVQS